MAQVIAPGETVTDGFTAAEILHHDKLIRGLLTAVRTHRQQAKAAGGAINSQIHEEIAQRHARRRSAVTAKLALLEVAKRCVLEPEVMNARTYRLNRSNPPKGFDLLGIPLKGNLRHWMEEAYKAAGHFDLDLRRELVAQIEWFDLAHRGRGGTKRARRSPINLEEMSAFDGYVAVVSRERKQKPEIVRSELDPSKAIQPGAIPSWAIGLGIARLLKLPAERALLATDAWQIVVVTLICEEPKFDPMSVGIVGLPPWDWAEKSIDLQERLWGPRKRILDHLKVFSKHDELVENGTKRRLWLMAERALFELVPHHSKRNAGLIEDLRTTSLPVVVHSPCALTIAGLSKYVGRSVGTIQSAFVPAKLVRPERGKRSKLDPHQVSRIARARQESRQFDLDERKRWNELLVSLGESPLEEPLKAKRRFGDSNSKPHVALET